MAPEMSISYQRRVVFLSLVITLTACESDTDKLQRLNGDRATHCLLAQKYRQDMDSLTKKAYGPARDTVLEKWGDHNTKCELATRDLNRFMRE